MMRLCKIAFFVFILCLFTWTKITAEDMPSNPLVKDGWNLDVHDEFDNDVNLGLWIPYYLEHRTTKEQAAARYEVRDGKLVLKIDQDQLRYGGDGSMTVSSFQTAERDYLHKPRAIGEGHATPDDIKYTPLYGYFEIRAKMYTPPEGFTNAGLHSSFWAQGKTDLPTQDGEFDIFEILSRSTNRITSTIHGWDDPNLSGLPGNKELGKAYDAAYDTAKEFHIYAMEWTPTKISVYIDNVKRMEFNYTINYPLLFLLNIYSQTGWTGDVDPTAPFPKEFEVDYFRAYTKQKPQNLAQGKTVNTKTSVENNLWGASRLIDGKTISYTDNSIGYSSQSYNDPNQNEWVEIDLGQNTKFDQVQFLPVTFEYAASGGNQAYPVDYQIEIKKENGEYKNVKTVRGQATPRADTKPIEVGKQDARYIRLNVTKLGNPSWSSPNQYQLRLAEFGVYNTEDIPALIDYPETKYAYTDPIIHYTGTWVDYTTSAGVKCKYPKTAGDYLEVTFTGTQFELIGVQNSWQGEIEAWVDNVKIYTGDSFVKTGSYKTPVLENKEHIVKIVYTKNMGSATSGPTLEVTNVKLYKTVQRVQSVNVLQNGNVLNSDNPIVLTKNQAVTLTTSVLPINAANKAVYWEVENSKVATVDQNGKLTAIVNGTTNLLVTSKDGNDDASFMGIIRKAVIPITVGTVDESIHVLPSVETITSFDQLITVTASCDSYNGLFEWSLSDTAYASVVSVSEDTKTVTLKPKRNGSVEVIAGTDNGKINKTTIYIEAFGNETLVERTQYFHVSRYPFTFTGSWSDDSSMKKSGTYGDKMSFSFEGKQFKLAGSNAITQGKMKVYVDGKEVYYGDSFYYGLGNSNNGIWLSPVVEDAAHKVEIVNMKEPGSGGGDLLWIKDVFFYRDVYRVKTISLPSEVILNETNKSADLTPIFNPLFTTDKNVVWTVENSAIATVDQNGRIKGLSNGTTMVKATAMENDDELNFSGSKVYATVTVSVNFTSFVNNVSLTASKETLSVGETTVITADTGFADNTSLIWDISNKDVAFTPNISEDTHTISIKAFKKGSFLVTAKTTDGSNIVKTYTITVVNSGSDPVVTQKDYGYTSAIFKYDGFRLAGADAQGNRSFVPYTAGFHAKMTFEFYGYQFKLTGKQNDWQSKIDVYDNGALIAQNVVCWSAASGVYTSPILHNGKHIITVVCRWERPDGSTTNIAYEFTKLTTLTSAYLQSAITVSGKTVSTGETVQLKAENLTPGNEVSWFVDDEKIASVDENGLLKPIKNGRVRVTATLKSNPLITSYIEVEVKSNFNLYELKRENQQVKTTSSLFNDTVQDGKMTVVIALYTPNKKLIGLKTQQVQINVGTAQIIESIASSNETLEGCSVKLFVLRGDLKQISPYAMVLQRDI